MARRSRLSASQKCLCISADLKYGFIISLVVCSMFLGSCTKDENGGAKVAQQQAGDVVTAHVGNESSNESGSARGNRTPRIKSVSFSPPVIYRGVDITAEVSALDPVSEGIRYNYRWSVNGEFQPDNSPVLKGTSFKKGDKISVSIEPYDGEITGPVYKAVVVNIPNAPPAFISLPALNFKGTTYVYNAVAQDLDGDPITYSLATAPTGMTIDQKTGTVVWQIAKGSEGTHQIEIVASDPDGAKSIQQYSLTISLNDQP